MPQATRDDLAVIGQNLGTQRSYINRLSNAGNRRYFSSTDAVVRFGNVPITEAINIQWCLVEPKMPLYGYNSFVFDEMAIGSRQITGAFVINYVTPFYLYKVQETKDTGSDNNIIYDSTTESDNPSPGNTQFKYMPQDFDLVVSYGGESNTTAIPSSEIWIEHIHLQDCTQIVGENGEPIFEKYSFIAKDMKYVN